jgi:hypothetical protein
MGRHTLQGQNTQPCLLGGKALNINCTSRLHAPAVSSVAGGRSASPTNSGTGKLATAYSLILMCFDSHIPCQLNKRLQACHAALAVLGTTQGPPPGKTEKDLNTILEHCVVQTPRYKGFAKHACREHVRVSWQAANTVARPCFPCCLRCLMSNSQGAAAHVHSRKGQHLVDYNCPARVLLLSEHSSADHAPQPNYMRCAAPVYVLSCGLQKRAFNMRHM